MIKCLLREPKQDEVSINEKSEKVHLILVD